MKILGFQHCNGDKQLRILAWHTTISTIIENFKINQSLSIHSEATSINLVGKNIPIPQNIV